jgi:UDP-N-acetylmuramyl pentapeptide phosphotransferase/UDP-N-acetylglucosamine-1-phosphate transferase
VPVGAGLVLVLACVVVLGAAEAVQTVVAAGQPLGGQPGVFVTVAAVLGFGLLGLVDDLAAEGDDKGFAGHLRALASGRLTTGGLKLFGGAVLAVALVAIRGQSNLFELLVDGALVALAANLANLFDRAPGRVTKVGLLAAVALVLASASDDQLVGLVLVVGAAVGLLWADLGEELMLGDAGANPIGAALGLGVVLSTGTTTRLIVAVVLLGLNLLSEKVSFSRVIDATPPLRRFDRFGRRRD